MFWTKFQIINKQTIIMADPFDEYMLVEVKSDKPWEIITAGSKEFCEEKLLYQIQKNQSKVLRIYKCKKEVNFSIKITDFEIENK